MKIELKTVWGKITVDINHWYRPTKAQISQALNTITGFITDDYEISVE